MDDADDIVWEGGGLNVLGLPYDLDMLPQYRYAQDAYVGFAALAFDLLPLSAGAALNQTMLASLREFANVQVTAASNASIDAKKSQAIAESEERNAADEVRYRQQALDKLTADSQTQL